MIHQAFCVIWKQLRNLGLESRCGKQQVEVWSIKNRCETSRLGDEQMPGYSLSCFRSPPVLREASMAPGLLNPDVCIGWALEISRSFHRGDWPGDDGSEVFIWSWYAGRQSWSGTVSLGMKTLYKGQLARASSILFSIGNAGWGWQTVFMFIHYW